MNARFRLVPIFIVFMVVVLACVPSLGSNVTQPSSDQVATVVAQTLQALTPDATSTSEVSANLLPQSLYFLGMDNRSLYQVYRVERDGKTQTQLTSEAVNVLGYDVSRRDGSFAYEIDNQLVLLNADGSNRRVLAEGAARGNVYSFYRPVFSPDGQTLAYSNGGINLYDIASGTTNLVVPDRPDDASMPREFYVPESFSPDGKKLLVHSLHSDTSSIAMYDLATNTLVPFAGKTDDDFACCQFGREIVWSPDGGTLFSANPSPGVDPGGLWRVNTATGEVTLIVPYGNENNTFNFVDEPYAAPDGRFYYFFSNYSGDLGPLQRAPGYLEIARIAGDSWTESTTLLHSESLRMLNEALWAPDGSFVIVALASSEDVHNGGQAEIVYLDGRPNVVLAPFTQQMKWGP